MKRIISLFGLVAFISSCAFTPASFNETNFNETNIDKLRIGMSATEVRAMFGAPSEVRTDVCGGNTAGGSWVCETWKYPTSKAYRTNDFVFSVKDDGKYLNNWSVRR
jgi:hypothetical protein